MIIKIKNTFIFCLGTFLNAFGIALAAKANIGITPISCFPYVVSIATPLTFGMTTCIWSVIVVISEVLVVGKEFPKVQYLQLALAFLLGFFIDVSLYLLKIFTVETYFLKLIVVLAGGVIMGFGISMQVKKNILLLPIDGLVKAIAGKISREFGYIKIILDVVIVILAAFTSFILMGSVEGIREGTVILAILTGFVIKFFLKKL
ncbi:DUF6198 family protein [Selenomonadales bacterium OttesenSCG-928-I06]|nr:DUF6198 family protein [Selenomonadales bacterium OttesenSCG-928-I06]